MKTLVFILALTFAFPMISLAQTSGNPFLQNYKKYEKIILSIEKKEGKKNKKYAHMNYKEGKRRTYKTETPFTFARRKTKSPQNSYSYNW